MLFSPSLQRSAISLFIEQYFVISTFIEQITSKNMEDIFQKISKLLKNQKIFLPQSYSIKRNSGNSNVAANSALCAKEI